MNLFRRKEQQDKPVKQINVAKSKWRFVVWGIVIVILGIAGWIGITGGLALRNIISDNSSDQPTFFKDKGSITVDDVKTEGDSRINILLAGIGGPGHDGPDLTDTLEVISIDPVNNTMAMLSVPRDLYVKQADGEWTKVNAVNALASQIYCKVNKTVCVKGVDAGGAAMKDMLQKVLGIKIAYFARINFNGFKSLVDQVGGIDITVPTPLSDYLYPCPDPSTAYCPLYIKAGLQHMNGDTALKYARSRETSSDFDRSKRQQLVMEGIMKKSLTLGILTNPVKITNVINILGGNLKTDMQITDMTNLFSVVKNIDSSRTTNNVLDTSANGPLTDKTSPSTGYIIYPRAGLGDYSGVQAFAAHAFQDPYVIKEGATIAVINATGKSTEGSALETALKNLGYNVVSVTAATSSQKGSTVTDSSSNPFTVKLLTNRFGATSAKASTNGADITLTVGSNYLTTK